MERNSIRSPFRSKSSQEKDVSLSVESFPKYAFNCREIIPNIISTPGIFNIRKVIAQRKTKVANDV